MSSPNHRGKRPPGSNGIVGFRTKRTDPTSFCEIQRRGNGLLGSSFLVGLGKIFAGDSCGLQGGVDTALSIAPARHRDGPHFSESLVIDITECRETVDERVNRHIPLAFPAALPDFAPQIARKLAPRRRISLDITERTAFQPG